MADQGDAIHECGRDVFRIRIRLLLVVTAFLVPTIPVCAFVALEVRLAKVHVVIEERKAIVVTSCEALAPHVERRRETAPFPVPSCRSVGSRTTRTWCAATMLGLNLCWQRVIWWVSRCSRKTPSMK